jgi:hypothetical protein
MYAFLLPSGLLALLTVEEMPLSMSYSRNMAASLTYICNLSPMDHKETRQLPAFLGWNKIMPRRSKVCWTMHFDHVHSCLHWNNLCAFNLFILSWTTRQNSCCGKDNFCFVWSLRSEDCDRDSKLWTMFLNLCFDSWTSEAELPKGWKGWTRNPKA